MFNLSYLVTCISTSVAWCFCSACGSLLGSCCGNDKPTSIAPGPTSGRKRSVFLLFLSICISLVFQYGVAYFIVNSWQLATITNSYFQDVWLDGCIEEEDYNNNNNNKNNNDDDDLVQRCASNNGNFRVSAATTLFFMIASLAVLCKPTANREAWPAKFVLYLFMVAATVPIPNDPWFSDIYMNIARVGGILFILVQQIIILDVSFNWNDKWVENSNKANSEEGNGAGNKWLAAIMISCFVLFTIAITGLILMLIYYTGCTSNNAFIGSTLVLCIGITIAQLTGEESSLLTSACITTWTVYLCYSAVTKNPNTVCNPRLADMNWINIVFGLVQTLISLCWVAWSWTAEDKMIIQQQQQQQSNKNDEEDGYNSKNENNEDDDHHQKKKTPAVTGIVTETNNYGTTTSTTNNNDPPVIVDDNENNNNNNNNNDPKKLSNSWRLNIALASISCWTCMVLTDWGAIQADGTIANSSTGQTSMWMIMAAQWIILLLYLWTLIAPRLFPDRDFS